MSLQVICLDVRVHPPQSKKRFIHTHLLVVAHQKRQLPVKVEHDGHVVLRLAVLVHASLVLLARVLDLELGVAKGSGLCLWRGGRMSDLFLRCVG